MRGSERQAGESELEFIVQSVRKRVQLFKKKTKHIDMKHTYYNINLCVNRSIDTQKHGIS